MQNIKSENGITLLILVVTVIVLILISVPVIMNTTEVIDLQRYTYFKGDIDRLRESINVIYKDDNSINTIGPKYTGDLGFLSLMQNGEIVKNPNDGEDYYVIDLKELNSHIEYPIELKYGSGNKIEDYSKLDINQGKNTTDINVVQYEYQGKDTYIINAQSKTIYYTDGIEYKSNKYYRLPEDFTELSDVFIVSYDANGGMNAPKMQVVEAFENPSITLGNAPTRYGYIFKGWKVEDDETLYQPGENYTLNRNVTFIAQWEKDLIWKVWTSSNIVELNLIEADLNLIIQNNNEDLINDSAINYEISIQDDSNCPFEVTINGTIINGQKYTGNLPKSENQTSQTLPIHIKKKDGHPITSNETLTLIIKGKTDNRQKDEIINIGVEQYNIIDYSGNNIHAKLINGAKIVKDEDGYCISFDGIDDYAQIAPITLDHTWQYGFGIETKVKYEAFNSFSPILMLGDGPDKTEGQRRAILLQNDGTTAKARMFVDCFKEQWPSYYREYRSSSENAVFELNKITDLKYKVWTKSSTGEYNSSIYKSNVKQSSSSGILTNRLAAYINKNARNINYIGKSYWEGDGYFKGKIYNLKLYLQNGDVSASQEQDDAVNNREGTLVFKYDLNR